MIIGHFLYVPSANRVAHIFLIAHGNVLFISVTSKLVANIPRQVPARVERLCANGYVSSLIMTVLSAMRFCRSAFCRVSRNRCLSLEIVLQYFFCLSFSYVNLNFDFAFHCTCTTI